MENLILMVNSGFDEVVAGNNNGDLNYLTNTKDKVCNHLIIHAAFMYGNNVL